MAERIRFHSQFLGPFVDDMYGFYHQISSFHINELNQARLTPAFTLVKRHLTLPSPYPGQSLVL